MLNGPIHDDLANTIVAQLLYLESENPDKPVRPSQLHLVVLVHVLALTGWCRSASTSTRQAALCLLA